MTARWVDVSIPMRPGMTFWPGDTPFAWEASSRIAEGAGCNVSRIAMSTHAGTHVDAPWHFEDGGKKLDELDPEVFFGEALLMDLSQETTIRAAALGPRPLPQRVLFKTRNSWYSIEGALRTDFVALEPDAAQRLADEGVRLVGIDYFSIAPYKQAGQETHHILLRKDILIVEGLRLGELAAGRYEFVVLPLPLAGADGAPCRAFLRRKEDEQ